MQETKKITILIGPNGSGKTTYVNKIKEEFNKNCIFQPDNETLENLHKGISSLFSKAGKKLQNGDDKLKEKDSDQFKLKKS